MILTAKRHKKWATIVLLGAAALGAELGTSISHNSDQINAVKQARQAAILLVCQQGNERHDNTISALKKLSHAAIRKHPERKKEIVQSFAPTVLLIDALAPKYDCAKRVKVLSA